MPRGSVCNRRSIRARATWHWQPVLTKLKSYPNLTGPHHCPNIPKPAGHDDFNKAFLWIVSKALPLGYFSKEQHDLADGSVSGKRLSVSHP